MKRFGVLNHQLAAAIAQMGHDDIMIVCDAGFPIIYDGTAKVIDLAIVPGVPDLATVLKALRQEMWVERWAVIEGSQTSNPQVARTAREVFPDALEDARPNAWFHEEGYRAAKYVVRTGGWMPWGNVALWSGIPVEEWFAATQQPVPAEWHERHEKSVAHGHEGLDVAPKPR
jgi:D-ribose pyranase